MTAIMPHYVLIYYVFILQWHTKNVKNENIGLLDDVEYERHFSFITIKK